VGDRAKRRHSRRSLRCRAATDRAQRRGDTPPNRGTADDGIDEANVPSPQTELVQPAMKITAARDLSIFRLGATQNLRSS